MIECKIKCRCGTHAVMVRERREGEPVEAWFADCRRAVSDAHRTLSPLCLYPKADIWIPLQEGLPVGQRPRDE